MQISLLMIFTLLKNDELKAIILNILVEVANADEEIDDYEAHFFSIYDGLYDSSLRLEYYQEELERITRVQSNELYSSKGSNLEKYNKKMKNALNSYAKDIGKDMIISLYDATMFGKGDEGFIVTPLAIVTDQAEHNRVIPLGNIYDIEIEDYQINFFSKPDDNGEIENFANMICTTADLNDFIAFLLAIAEINKAYEESMNMTEDEEIETVIAELEAIESQERALLSDIKEWHLAHNNNQLGLHSLQDIDKNIAHKELVADGLLVWKDGMSEWIPAIEIEEINSIIESYKVATPPPLPSTPPPPLPS